MTLLALDAIVIHQQILLPRLKLAEILRMTINGSIHCPVMHILCSQLILSCHESPVKGNYIYQPMFIKGIAEKYKPRIVPGSTSWIVTTLYISPSTRCRCILFPDQISFTLRHPISMYNYGIVIYYCWNLVSVSLIHVIGGKAIRI